LCDRAFDACLRAALRQQFEIKPHAHHAFLAARRCYVPPRFFLSYTDGEFDWALMLSNLQYPQDPSRLFPTSGAFR